MFENSLEAVQHPRYLGKASVVETLVRQFAAEVLRADELEEVHRACNNFSEIFAGMDASYPAVQGWANRSRLGADLERFVHVDPSQSFIDMVRTAFMTWASELFELAQDEDEEAARNALDLLVDRVVAVLMGTASMQLSEDENG